MLNDEPVKEARLELTQYGRDQLAAESPEERQARLLGNNEHERLATEA